MIRLVLFDIDGTLIQTGGAGEKAFAKTCASEFGIANGTVHLQFAGRTDHSLARQIFTRHGIEVTPVNFRRFFDRYVFYLDHFLAGPEGTVLPGVEELIGGLHGLAIRPTLGLLTGNIRLGARLKLERYGLWHHFRTGAFGDDHEDRNQLAILARERSRDLFPKALEGDEILIIGDTPLDIECARAIGARSLAVATGRYPKAELQRESPTWAVDHLGEVLADVVCR